MKHARTRRYLTIAVVIIAAAFLIRATLPLWVERYVNGRLADIGDYRGQVADVDLALIRGAYVLHDLTIIKQPALTEQPFLALPRMDISVEWRALMDGRLVGEMEMRDPVLNMVQGSTDEDTQVGAGVNWPAEVRELFPFNINRTKVTGGTVTFRAPGISTDESLTLRNLQLVLNNLTNVVERDESSFADFDVNASFGEDAPLAIRGKLDPNARQPTFDVDMSLERARLVDTNPWLEKFLNVDAERGEFFMYAELAAADGRFEGYIRPILEDAEVFRLDEPADNPLQKAWEALVELAANVLENPEEEQVATQIPFSGELENPEAELLPAAVNLLRNAFVAAFTHALEGSVSLEDVESGEEE